MNDTQARQNGTPLHLNRDLLTVLSTKYSDDWRNERQLFKVAIKPLYGRNAVAVLLFVCILLWLIDY